MKACTNTEQIRKLLALGIPSESADMNIPFFEKKGTYIEGIPTMKPYSEVYKELYCALSKDEAEKRVLPCWSLAALLELMPPTIVLEDKELDFDCIKNDSKYYMCYSGDGLFRSKNGHTAIEAAYNMIIWLKENKYI